jgi:hypothetical protein
MLSVYRLPFMLAVVLSLLAAAPAAEGAKRRVPQGFYGTMWDRGVTEAQASVQAAQWDLMARSGVESVRTVFSWADAQPVDGAAPSFAATDRVVALAAARRIRLLPVVRWAPVWALHSEPGTVSLPARVDDFTFYLEALVRRYGPEGSFWEERPDVPRRPLREWQIWNEPHLSDEGNDEDVATWTREYARLLRAADATLDYIDPGSVTVLAGLADFAWDHLERLYRAGIRGHYDVAAINLFTRRPALVLKGLGYVRRELRRGGEPRKPIWLTETTWPASKGRVPKPRASWQRAWETTDQGMARRLRTFYRLAVRERRRLRLGRVYWYTWASDYSDRDLFDFAGLTSFSDGVLMRRPALAAYTASARRDQGCRKTAAGTCR